VRRLETAWRNPQYLMRLHRWACRELVSREQRAASDVTGRKGDRLVTKWNRVCRSSPHYADPGVRRLEWREVAGLEYGALGQDVALR
jgi:hypothetical protein